MSRIEFLLLIPAIIYGIAIVDLLKVFRFKKKYWEIVFWGIIWLEIIVLNWIELFNKLDSFVSSNLNFVLLVIHSILYAQVAALITPETEEDHSEAYLESKRVSMFAIMVAISLMGTIIGSLVFDDHRNWIRLIGVPLFGSCIFISNKWWRTSIGAILFLLGLFYLFKSSF